MILVILLLIITCNSCVFKSTRREVKKVELFVPCPQCLMNIMACYFTNMPSVPGHMWAVTAVGSRVM